MKLRPIAFVSGAVLAAIATLILTVRIPTLRTPAQAMSSLTAARTPSSDGRTEHSPWEISNPCTHLYRLICSKTGVTRDPTGSVRPDVDGEQMAIDLYSKIAQEHPDFTVDQVNQEALLQIYTPRNRGRIESAFRWVRHTIEQLIEIQPETVFTPWEKKQLKHRLREIELQLPPPLSVYEDEPDLITKNDVYYERLDDGKMRLRVGGAYFFTTHSWFNTVFTLAHELAHGIDPCEIRNAHLAFPSYDRVSACFMQQKLVPLRKNRAECGQNDQLSETFADWIAVQVTARTLRNYATEFHGEAMMNAAVNAVRDLCETPEEQADRDGFHPPDSVRIDRIFGRNPEIREILGCEPNTNLDYCSFHFTVGK